MIAKENRPPVTRNQKEKNLVALSVLLIGLFVGSLFVDLTQLFTGSGFSGRVASTYDVLPGRDKTWVAYDDPKVTLDLVTQSDCEACNADEALLWLRRVIPTLEVRQIEAESALGREYVERFGLTAIPAFVFSESLTETDFYTQAQALFTERDGKYAFRMADLGLPAGKYLVAPPVNENDIVIGNADAPLTVIEYSDFQCPYCQTFHAALLEELQGRAGEVRYVFKNLPLINVHAQALNAALASECAHEQGSFAAYSDLLFARQSEWTNSTGTNVFKVYAIRLGLNHQEFAACLDGQKHLAKLQSLRDEAAEFGIGGTPATFVNNEFLKGDVSQEAISNAFSQALAR